MQNVSWKREGKWILKDVSWQIAENEHWGIIGLNGSGKTTLLNIINGYIWPTVGQISVLGERFGEVELQKVRQQIGWISSSLQERFHKNHTARSIVLSGKFATIGLYQKTTLEDEEEAVHLLEAFGCSYLADQQYQTLSQGEKQKVLIARALMAKPKLLIFDEPCTGLDLISREQVLQMIQMISEQSNAPTMIFVTHHVEEILPCFSHVLLMKEGQAYQTGETASVLTTEQLSSFFQVPVQMTQRGDRRWLMLENNIRFNK